MREPRRLAVLGAGHVGPVIARLAIRAGYPVAIATSGDPEDIALITELVIPGAQPRWAADAVADADIVVLAIPLHRFLEVDPGLLHGKLVVDAMNYWPASDGVLKAFEDGGSSEIVARRLSGTPLSAAAAPWPALPERRPSVPAADAGSRSTGVSSECGTAWRPAAAAGTTTAAVRRQAAGERRQAAGSDAGASARSAAATTAGPRATERRTPRAAAEPLSAGGDANHASPAFDATSLHGVHLERRTQALTNCCE
jgi:8-hydroxy-5-deazaflavin:NADPH oxidoreductase